MINNYWTKHNIKKIVCQPKDTSPKNKCTKFQVDALIRSRDIVYTVLKNIFFRKTRLKFWYQFFQWKNLFKLFTFNLLSLPHKEDIKLVY